MNTSNNHIENLKAQFFLINKEIESMVYELYGLSEEEIGVVEGEK